MILPIFYLLHGEAYDSDDPSTMNSYSALVSKSQVNIHCLKCRALQCNTACLEFLYHNTNRAKRAHEPIDITVNTRGAPFNSLHYLTTHSYFGLVPEYGEDGQIMMWKRQPIQAGVGGPSESRVETDQYGQVVISKKRSHQEATDPDTPGSGTSSDDTETETSPRKRRKTSI